MAVDVSFPLSPSAGVVPSDVALSTSRCGRLELCGPARFARGFALSSRTQGCNRGKLVPCSAWGQAPLSPWQRLLGGAASVASDFRFAARDAVSQLTPATTTLVILAFLLGSMIGLAAGRYRRIRTALDISIEDVKRRRQLSSLVVAVADGDTIRIRHRPWWARWRSLPGNFRRSTESIAIRIAAVDAPEMPHQGRPGQPFAQESKDFTSKQVLGRRVSVRVLARDQYGRIVARVSYGMWPFRKNLSKELLQQGLATLYRSSGGRTAFEGEQDKCELIEQAARQQKIGMWSLGEKLTLPGEYKAEG